MTWMLTSLTNRGRPVISAYVRGEIKVKIGD